MNRREERLADAIVVKNRNELEYGKGCYFHLIYPMNAKCNFFACLYY